MQAKIIEHVDIVSVLTYLNNRTKHDSTLVIFDIDNTLIEPVNMITSTEWFEYSMEKLLAEGVSHQEASAQLLDLCVQIQEAISMKYVEESSRLVIEQIKKVGAQVLGLTSRSPLQAQKTIEQLANFGFNLKSSKFEADGSSFATQEPYFYHQGVLFCYFYSKGKALVQILQRFEYRPKKIIFIDDVLRNLHIVAEALHDFDKTIYFTGIHYTRLAYKKIFFDPSIAERELALIRSQ